MACGTLAQRGGEQAAEGQTANQSGQSKTHACRVVGLMRVETYQKALAEAVKPDFQSLENRSFDFQRVWKMKA